MLIHVLSPVLGGILTQYLDFHAIFWVQLILGIVAVVLVIVFLPETHRTIAGNGTMKLKNYQEPLSHVLKSSRDARFNSDPASIPPQLTVTAFLEPFLLLSRVTIFASAIFGAIVFATSAIIISTTAIFLETRYGLSTAVVGAAFLPSGVGSIVASVLTPFILDRDYKTTETRYKDKFDIYESQNQYVSNHTRFPIERARLRNIWWITILFIATTIAYGFSLSSKHVALPLVLQFFTAFGATAIILINGVLITDLCPGNSASATTVVNFVRYCLGGLSVGVVMLIVGRVGSGNAFLIFAMLCLGATPILVLQGMFGVKWRMGEKTTLETERAVEWAKDIPRRFIVRLPESQGRWKILKANAASLWETVSWNFKRLRDHEWKDFGLKEKFGGCLVTFRDFSRSLPSWRELRGKVWRTATS